MIESSVVTPAPYMKLSMGCSYRSFANDVYSAIHNITKKYYDGEIECESEFLQLVRDSDGDLSKIIIYSSDIGCKIIKDILDDFNCMDIYHSDMELHLTCI